MVSVFAAQEVGNIDCVLVGGVTAIGKNVGALGEAGIGSCMSGGNEGREEITYLKDLRRVAKDIADYEDGGRGV